MLSERIMSRLGELNRRRAPGGEPAGDAAVARAVARLPSLAPRPLDDRRVDQLPAGKEVRTASGNHWLRQVPTRQLWPDASRQLHQWAVTPSDLGTARHKGAAELAALAAAFPQSAVFLDLETCGFAGSMVFLIGIIHHRHDQLVLSQLLARHYGEEKAILQSLCDVVANQSILVTFNGKSFDWPMVLDRLTLHRIEARVGDLPFPLVHCDLLHHARRCWRDKLPDCKLQTLEQALFGRRRAQDISGSEIPAAYHDFVRTGDAWLMRRVLHHNALDLVTLLQLSRGLVTRATA